MNEDKNVKKIRKASLVLEDQIVETIYDKKLEQTQFAVYKNKKVAKMTYLCKVRNEARQN